MLFFILICKLIIGHFIADFPLQGDFLAKAKNHVNPIAGVNPIFCLLAHSAIQAGMVWYITGYGPLALVEFFLHAAIDYNKSENNIDFSSDQILHILCKIVYAMFVVAN